MGIYRTTNGLFCQILIGHGFEPIMVEYIKHLRMTMIFKQTPKLEKLLKTISETKSFNEKILMDGFMKYHLLLNIAEKEIGDEEQGWYIEKDFLELANQNNKNE